MNLFQSSKILEFFSRFGSSWQNSRTRKAVDAFLRFWDRMVSGSASVAWLTGDEPFNRKFTHKPSLFAEEIQKCWSSFLGFVRRNFVESESLKASFITKSAMAIKHYLEDNFLGAIGWIGCAFFPFYGTLRNLFAGSSNFILLFSIVGFLLSILLVLTSVKLTELIKTSRLLKVFDELDQ